MVNSYIEKLNIAHAKLSEEKGIYKFSNVFPLQDLKYGTPINKELFRFWPVAEDSKHRIEAFKSENPKASLEIFTDFLYDYAPIICYHIEKMDVDNYNTNALIQVGECGLNCWHCFVKWEEAFQKDNLISLSAQEVFDKFLQEHDNSLQYYNKDSSKVINVLRISGGEPFIITGFIIEILELFRDYNDKDLYVWTETNLTPFIEHEGEIWINTVYNDALERLKELKNFFCLHPCTHGISDFLLNEVCFGISDKMLNEARESNGSFIKHLLDGLKVLVHSKINIYPTVGCNVNSVTELESFFKELIKIHPNLPLRFALIEYKFHYDHIRKRMNRNINKYEKIYNHVLFIDKWDALIKKYCPEFEGYGVNPRYTIPLD